MPEERVGTVLHFYRKISVAILRLEAPLRVGEMLRIKGAHDDVVFRVDSMQVQHADVPQGTPGQEVGVKVPGRVHEGSVAYREAA